MDASPTIRDLTRHPGIRSLPLRFKLFVWLNLAGPGRTVPRVVDGKLVVSTYLPPFPGKAFDTFVSDLHLSRKGDTRPEIVNIAVTHRCNDDCWHCIAPEREGDDPDAGALKRAISGLQDLGTYSFLLTGGDPLMRGDILDIVGAVDERSVVSISTTGEGLTPERAGALKEAGLHAVFIGLEDTDGAINDRLRGREGAHRRAWSAVRSAREAGLLVALSMVATRDMVDSGRVWRYLEEAGRRGIDEVAVFEPMPCGRMHGDASAMLPEAARQELVKLQKKGGRKGLPRVIAGPFMDSMAFMGCTAGFNRLHIDADGEVRPCDVLPFSYGNITKAPISEIWRRMRSDFPGPRESCLMLEHHDAINQGVAGGETLGPAECMRMCGGCKGSRMPRFFKKLGLRPG